MSDKPDTPNTEETPRPSQPDTSQGSNEGNEGQFTQADLDRISTRVRKEAREAERKKMLEDLGLDDLDSLKTFVDEARVRKEAEMSETEKLNAALEAERQKTLAAQQSLQELQTKRVADSQRAVFTNAVRNSGGTDEGELHILVNASLGDEFKSVFGDDGITPDEGKLTAFIKTVQSKYPKYFGTAGAGSPSNINGVSPRTADFTKEAEASYRRRLRS